jgi:hypothetical protein
MLCQFLLREAIAGRHDGGDPVQEAGGGTAGVQLLVEFRVGVVVQGGESVGGQEPRLQLGQGGVMELLVLVLD